MLRRMLGTLALFLTAASAQAQTLAQASDWPNKPITILMGFPAGSGVDVVARLLEEPMEKSVF